MFTLRNFLTVTPQFTASQTSRHWRVSALLPVLGILTATIFFAVSPVGAQVPQQLSQQTGFIDPPGRVARMNLAEGPVSVAPAGTGEPRWTPALLNRPLTTGDRLWTGQRARSELHIGSTAVRLSEQTSLDFLALDDDTTQLRLAQGTMKLRVRQLFDGQRIEINTPNLAFVITQPGDYRIDANPASNVGAGTTRVVVQQGAGTMYGDGGAQVNIAAGQQASFTDTQLTPAGPTPGVQDSFDAWAYQRDRLEDQSVSARYVPREVVGYQQLDSYGNWSQDPTYGAVWLPRAVPVNWAPYRAGHWSWIAPWGWTWVDDAPWGFAPFHYGRWAQIGPRWGWVPGQLAARPVYAPALVAFIGGNAGGEDWNVSIGQQAARPGLGWFPLAPGEAYRPAYQHSPRYVTRVNQNIAVTPLNGNHNYRYHQRGDAVSVMNADDFARGQRVRPEAQRLNPADLSRAQLLVPERGGLPQRLPGLIGLRELRELPRAAGPAALPPALPQPAAAPDRGLFDAEQRARAEQQRLGRDQQRQQTDMARQQEQQRRQAEDAIGQRALQEQAGRQQQAQRQLQLQQQAQQAQQRAQQDQARQQQLQQRAQQEQQRQARDQPQLQPQPSLQPQLRQPPDSPRDVGHERQPPRRADAPSGGAPRLDERIHRQRD